MACSCTYRWWKKGICVAHQQTDVYLIPEDLRLHKPADTAQIPEGEWAQVNRLVAPMVCLNAVLGSPSQFFRFLSMREFRLFWSDAFQRNSVVIHASRFHERSRVLRNHEHYLEIKAIFKSALSYTKLLIPGFRNS